MVRAIWLLFVAAFGIGIALGSLLRQRHVRMKIERARRNAHLPEPYKRKAASVVTR